MARQVKTNKLFDMYLKKCVGWLKGCGLWEFKFDTLEEVS